MRLKAIQQLVDRIKSDSVIVVMEATGGYENQLVQALHKHGIALAVGNPRRVRDFAKGIGKDAKGQQAGKRSKFYLHLVAKGKEKKVALIAAMRKFLTILNTLIKKDELWKTVGMKETSV